jgi:hypothetical protein
MSAQDEFKNHPYFSDYAVIRAAFEILKEKQKQNFNVLWSYKGALPGSDAQAIKQINWEDDRIKEVEKIIFELYNNHLCTKK